MNFIKQIAKLQRQQKEIEEGEENLRHKLTCDSWDFCLHLHYVETRISAWQKRDKDKWALFIVKQNNVEMLETGIDSWQEAKKILNERLLQEFKGEMNIAERIAYLSKLEQKFRAEIETIQTSLNSESEWLFCLHVLHYAELGISAWKRGDNSEVCASFKVKEGKVKVLTTGMYGDKCYEAHSILTKWVAPRIFREE